MPNAVTAMPQTGPGGIWTLRLLLAILFFLGGEILLWGGLPTHSPVEWALLAVGYPLLATLTLDFAARFRVRDVYGVLLVILIAGVLIALLLHPRQALVQFPYHIITRAIGGYGILTLEMFGLFLALTWGDNPRYHRLLPGFAGVVGFFGGIWAYEAHTLADWTQARPALGTFALLTAVTLIVALGAAELVRRRATNVRPGDLRLSQRAYAVVILLLAMIAFVQLLRGLYVGWELVASGLLIGLGWLVLWFEYGPRGHTLLDDHLPPRLLPLRWIAVGIVVFAAGITLGWYFPGFEIAGYTPISVIELGFLLGGFLWIPLTLTVAAARALNRRARKLEVL